MRRNGWDEMGCVGMGWKTTGCSGIAEAGRGDHARGWAGHGGGDHAGKNTRNEIAMMDDG